VQVAVVNPFREPGLERYWVPSILESALFGTRLADHWFEVDTGGDLAFLAGVLKVLVASNGVDQEFVRSTTTGFDEVSASLGDLGWAQIEEASGTGREQIEAFARLLVNRPKSVFVWSMGLTQHAHGVDTVHALVNVALARGLFMRRGCGVMPIRGHSGVQGGAEVGCAPGVDRESAEHWARVWGFAIPDHQGYTAVQMVERAALGDLDVFWIVGGNFLDTLPGRDRSLQALHRPRLRVHHDLVVSPSMLVDPSEAVLLLPAATRYESPGGGTETSTERRIIFSPEIPGRRVGSARPEWWALTETMARVRPESRNQIRFEDVSAIRAEIARAIPLYAGIEALSQKGDQVQWGGPQLYADGRFATEGGRARFANPRLRGPRRSADSFLLSTRRGKQFNSMVQRDVDPLTGAGRDDILMSATDADALAVTSGTRVRLVSESGEFVGRVRISPIKPGNLEVHWPEGMPLLGLDVDPLSSEPDYNAIVTVEKW
jgi:molybdopterin-dependent oxidoreductase alpha subunit